MAKSDKSVSESEGKAIRTKRSAIGCWFKAMAERMNLFLFQLIRTPGTQGTVKRGSRSGRKSAKEPRKS